MTTANEGTHSPDIAQAITQLEDAYENLFEKVKNLMDFDDTGANFKALTSAARNLGCLAVYLSDADEEKFEEILTIANKALNEISRATFDSAMAMYKRPVQ